MTSEQKILLLLIATAYVLGSIPFGLLVGKAKGIDVRTAGSKNIGATNVGRLLGGKYFALVFTLDLLKGLLPVLTGGFVINFTAPDMLTTLLWLGVGFAAIFGHMFSLFLGFKGGKGVATSAGVVLGFFPYFTLPAVVALLVWGAIFKQTRIVSLASIIAALLFPIAYIVFALIRGWNLLGEQLPLLIFSLLMAVMIVYRHRANIGRLRAGTEYRFGHRAATVSATNGDGCPAATAIMATAATPPSRAALDPSSYHPCMKDAYKPVWVIFFIVLGLIAVVGISRLVGHSTGDGVERVPWQSDFSAARAASAQQNKPILLYFTATWCGPCQEMKQTTWADEGVAAALAGYIPVKIDIDQQSELATQYQVQGIPRVEVVAPNGDRRLLSEGRVTPEQFLTLLKASATKP